MKYKFWDKQETIYTPSGAVFTADEFIETYAGWARNPNAKAIILDAVINGGVCMEFEQTKQAYIGMGMEVPIGTTDEDILLLMEQWDSTQKEAPPSAEERIAAAMEYQAMSALPIDVEDPVPMMLRSAPTEPNDQWAGDPTVLMNFMRRLWHWKQVKMLVGRTITKIEFIQLMRLGVDSAVITETVYAAATGETY